MYCITEPNTCQNVYSVTIFLALRFGPAFHPLSISIFESSDLDLFHETTGGSPGSNSEEVITVAMG